MGGVLMGAVAGYKTKTLYGREKTGTFGQDTATSFFLLPIEDGSPTKEKEFVKVGALTGYAGYTKAINTKISATAGFSFAFSYTGLEVLLLCAFGHEQINSVQSLGNGFYRHVIEPDLDLATDFFRTNEGWTTSDGLLTNTVKSRRITVIQDKLISQHKLISGFINSLSISGNAGDIVKGSVDLLGYDVKRVSFDTSAYSESTDVVNFADLNFTVGGITIGVSSFELRLSNNLSQTQKNSLHLDEPVRSGRREVTLKFTLPKYETDDFLQLYENGADVRVEMRFVKGDGHEIAIILPRAVITSTNANISGEGIIPNEVEMIALESTTPETPSGRNVEVYVELVNTISTEVWEL